MQLFEKLIKIRKLTGLCRKYVLVCTSYDNQLCINYNVDIVVNYVIKIIKKIFLAIVFFR